MRRSLLVVVLLGCLSLLGWAVARENAAREAAEAMHPMPGRLVSVGKHALHLDCRGFGTPTVLFESDLDPLGSLSWTLVHPLVASFTRACAYDRAGIMWSEPGPRPRDASTIADELRRALNAAGERGPYVVTAHAMGAVYGRVFAGRYAASTCGLVLVDGLHPDALMRAEAAGLESRKTPSPLLRPLAALMSSTGFPRSSRLQQYAMPQEVYETEKAFLSTSSLAWFDESSVSRESMEQASRYGNLMRKPLILIASGRPAPVNYERSRDVHLELQRDLLALSEHSELRIYDDVGHYIQFDRPERVVDGVRQVVATCREPSLDAAAQAR